ncbi:NAD(P)/FAD-dependent oxidoreductase [Umezawaea sp.]|uniref:NAD(P)/FAD-dependent oxidoreductase n=1 Tax=Umezawaea sp. TaxID=1955258 RepID=UPI002ED625EB
MPDIGRVVVVGASAAGLTTAESLRREGFDGLITLIGDELHLPYDRPPLSKQVLLGTWEPERTAFRDDATYQRLDVGLRLGATATGVDLDKRSVALASGDHVPYDRLVIATGVRPLRLRQGHDLAGVHVLRTLDDTLALRAALARATSVAVVGAGFLGSEAASAARTLGLDVTLVDLAPVPLSRQFGDELGGWVGDLHRENGVEVRTGVGVSALLGDGRVSGVALADGTTVDADVVLVAIGSAPATDWLTTSGIPLDDGVLCDSTCQAVPNVHAAGDVARWHNERFGALMRVEHRMNATEQAMAVARNILGDPKPFTPIPYFWTDQYDARIQAYGIFPPGSTMTVAQGDPAHRKFVAHYHHDGDLVGVLGWNMPRELRGARALLTQD